MATKPTVRIPLWASTGSKTDPGGSKEATGWVVSERPPANWINWIYNAVGQWLGWAEDSIDNIASRTTVSTNGSGGVSMLGGVGVATVSIVVPNYVRVTFSTAYTGAWDYQISVTPTGAGGGTTALFGCVGPNRSATYVDIGIWNQAGTIQNPATVALIFDFLAIGTS